VSQEAPRGAVLRRAQHPAVAGLTDRGTEFSGRESHDYELYLAVEDIDHSRTKTKSPQTTDVIDKQFLCSAEASRFSVPAYLA